MVVGGARGPRATSETITGEGRRVIGRSVVSRSSVPGVPTSTVDPDMTRSFNPVGVRAELKQGTVDNGSPGRSVGEERGPKRRTPTTVAPRRPNGRGWTFSTSRFLSSPGIVGRGRNRLLWTGEEEGLSGKGSPSLPPPTSKTTEDPGRPLFSSPLSTPLFPRFCPCGQEGRSPSTVRSPGQHPKRRGFRGSGPPVLLSQDTIETVRYRSTDRG